MGVIFNINFLKLPGAHVVVATPKRIHDMADKYQAERIQGAGVGGGVEAVGWKLETATWTGY